MLNKLIAAALNWLVLSVILPTMAFIWDVIKLRKENKELKKVIEEFKNAKTKIDIDSSIDKLP